MEVIIALVGLIGGILQIILFFKIWKMTDDVATIKEIISYSVKKNIDRTDENAEISATENDEQKTKTLGKFYVGQVVVLLETEDQMKIKEITGDGKLACYVNGGSLHKGDFSPSEVEDFKIYWERKKSLGL